MNVVTWSDPTRRRNRSASTLLTSICDSSRTDGDVGGICVLVSMGFGAQGADGSRLQHGARAGTGMPALRIEALAAL